MKESCTPLWYVELTNVIDQDHVQVAVDGTHKASDSEYSLFKSMQEFVTRQNHRWLEKIITSVRI
jgi:hypothetical protein